MINMRHFPTTNAPVTRAKLMILSLLWVISTTLCHGAEPNYEDLDLSLDMPQNEKVEVIQDDPHSNAVHIAHNIPTGSDIYVKQTNPYNASVHISLNVAKDCQVRAEMENMVNCALHISLNGASNSQVDASITKCFNSSIHLSFQNPVNTPVKLAMDESTQCQIHVSQNVPRNSPMDVTINGAIANEIVCSQSVPQSSPLTFTLEGTIQSNDPDAKDDGDGSANQVEVSQSAADNASPLQCTPECPPPDFVYEYDYYGNGDGSKTKNGDNGNVRVSVQNTNKNQQISTEIIQQSSSSNSKTTTKRKTTTTQSDGNGGVKTTEVIEENGQVFESSDPLNNPDQTLLSQDEVNTLGTGSTQNLDLDYPSDYSFDNNEEDTSNTQADPGINEPDIPYSDSASPHDQSSHDSPADNDSDYQVPDLIDVNDDQLSDHGNGNLNQDLSVDQQCPGGSLDVCIDVCPGSHPRAFAICVTECGQRCP